MVIILTFRNECVITLTCMFQIEFQINIVLTKDDVDLTRHNNINTDTDFNREMYKSGILDDFFSMYICLCYINETEDR